MRKSDLAKNRRSVSWLKANTIAVIAAGITFIGMGVSGVVLFASPLARLGSQLSFSFIAIDADGWTRVHIVFAILFLIAGTWHILLHMGRITSLLLGRAEQRRANWPEAVFFLVLATLVFVTAAVDLPPASWIIDLKYGLGRWLGQAS